jgi:hypothetical protein
MNESNKFPQSEMWKWISYTHYEHIPESYISQAAIFVDYLMSEEPIAQDLKKLLWVNDTLTNQDLNQFIEMTFSVYMARLSNMLENMESNHKGLSIIDSINFALGNNIITSKQWLIYILALKHAVWDESSYTDIPDSDIPENLKAAVSNELNRIFTKTKQSP